MDSTHSNIEILLTNFKSFLAATNHDVSVLFLAGILCCDIILFWQLGKYGWMWRFVYGLAVVANFYWLLTWFQVDWMTMPNVEQVGREASLISHFITRTFAIYHVQISHTKGLTTPDALRLNVGLYARLTGVSGLWGGIIVCYFLYNSLDSKDAMRQAEIAADHRVTMVEERMNETLLTLDNLLIAILDQTKLSTAYASGNRKLIAETKAQADERMRVLVETAKNMLALKKRYEADSRVRVNAQPIKPKTKTPKTLYEQLEDRLPFLKTSQIRSDSTQTDPGTYTVRAPLPAHQTH